MEQEKSLGEGSPQEEERWKQKEGERRREEHQEEALEGLQRGPKRTGGVQK